ncbi:short chain dehydrogenase [Isoalcanivorax pacificus W11-5]|uniref:Short chain dehydrogenase n=1 Tax=Isoalcanivorax pacificus W11-5 TaxID=391936 RepID=A0A0B4XP33_9GAMM|nr:SDR family NAD(P)-dependent oxidoreductase [Isoalcanivorax pacificus]AJD48042.1 short chain dehydrogenase [Isoalcanivorax pacificus W11-5]
MSSPAPSILITGGASGLGRALAELAARRGYRVAIADTHSVRSEEVCAQLSELNTEHLQLTCDIRRDSDVRQAVERIVRRWGQLDILINNAGIAGTGLFETLSDDDWRALLETNLLGTVRTCRAAVSAMKRQGSGHIINVAAVQGLIPAPGMSSYSATEAALIALSESLRSELQPLGIQVSVACPSFFRSNLADTLRASEPVSRARFERLLVRHDFSPAEIAERIFRGIDAGDFMILPQPGLKQVWRQKRWLPGRALKGMQALAEKLRR